MESPSSPLAEKSHILVSICNLHQYENVSWWEFLINFHGILASHHLLFERRLSSHITYARMSVKKEYSQSEKASDDRVQKPNKIVLHIDYPPRALYPDDFPNYLEFLWIQECVKFCCSSHASVHTWLRRWSLRQNKPATGTNGSAMDRIPGRDPGSSILKCLMANKCARLL